MKPTPAAMEAAREIESYLTRKLREQLGTQAAAAALLEVARETISRRESGRESISREAALAIQCLTGVAGRKEG